MMRAMLEKLEQPQVGKRKRKRKNHWPPRHRTYISTAAVERAELIDEFRAAGDRAAEGNGYGYWW